MLKRRRPPQTVSRTLDSTGSGRPFGFVLIEALITIAVISIGLVSIAGLLLNSLKASVSAGSRTQAAMLAEDIVDRMRANRTAALVASSPYNLTLAAATPSVTNLSATVEANVPSFDLNAWRTAVNDSLTGAQSSVSVDNVTGMVTILITWSDDRLGAANVATSGRLRVETKL
jgi:type IV pilus assembly protein PilV